MTLQEMEQMISSMTISLERLHEDGVPDQIQAGALLILAECAYRREMREGR